MGSVSSTSFVLLWEKDPRDHTSLNLCGNSEHAMFTEDSNPVRSSLIIIKNASLLAWNVVRSDSEEFCTVPPANTTKHVMPFERVAQYCH
jgi:hypothetical protein